MAFGSLSTGVSGLRTNQQALDVIGNNLANSNTSGYKSQRTRFADLFYQTLSPATAATASTGGTNALQTGFGAKTAAVDTILTQGSLEPSGNDLDLGLQGQGFFVVNTGTQNLFTRDGAFDVDVSNFLVSPATGFTVQRFGNIGEGTATTPAFQTPQDNRINIPFGTGVPGQATTTVSLQGNLSANAAINDTVTSAIQIFDLQGTAHTLNLTFTKTAANTWSIAGAIPAADGAMVDAAAGPLTFNNNGSLAGAPDVSMSIQFNNITVPQTLTLGVGTVNGFDGLTQFGGGSAASARSQNGFAAGSLTSVSVAKDGIVNGVFTNGQILPLAQLAIANFVNPAGLNREGNNTFSLTPQSGNALIGAGQTGGRGDILQGTLESSNVDVALEFTRLIIAQRGFQVNARTITVSDQVLQTLANIIQ